MNLLIQVIKSKNLFVIHEYTYGNLTKSYANPIADLPHHFRCAMTPNAKSLCTIFTTDGEVCAQSAQPLVRPKDILR